MLTNGNSNKRARQKTIDSLIERAKSRKETSVPRSPIPAAIQSAAPPSPLRAENTQSDVASFQDLVQVAQIMDRSADDIVSDNDPTDGVLERIVSIVGDRVTPELISVLVPSS